MKSKLYQVASRRKLRKKLKVIFHKFIRLRDKNLPCISCGKGRAEQAGHYWKAGNNPSIEFDEQNTSGQCVRCNIFLEGNRQGYREGLIKRYGEGVLQVLDIKRSLKTRWNIFEYEAMIRMYSEKIKELEK